MPEFTSGMNMQAKNPDNNPAFNQGQGQDPMVPQPIPQEPKSIREYINLIKAAGQVPSFTNVPGGASNAGGMDPQTGQPYQMGTPMEFGEIGRQGEIVPPGQPQPAIPEQGAGDPADKRISGDDPYVMAQERLNHMLPELWSQMFPGQESNTELSTQDFDRWQGAVQNMNNMLIKKYDKKIGDMHKDALGFFKAGYSADSVNKYKKSGNLKDLVKNIDYFAIREKALKDYNSFEHSEFDSKEAYADDKVKRAREFYAEKSGETTGEPVPGQPQTGQPIDVGQAPGQPSAPSATPEKTQMEPQGRAAPVQAGAGDEVEMKVEEARKRILQLKQSGYSKTQASKIIRNEFRDLVDLGRI